MKNLTLGLVAALAFALPTTAQILGSINNNLPTVMNAIKFANGAKVELEYKAINFGEGRFMENAKNERFREFVNGNAVKNPIGSLKLPAAMNIGGKDCAKGEYGVHFLISEKGNFVLTLSMEGELTQWELTGLKKADSKRERLTINLNAAAKATEAEIHLHFGNMHMDIPVKAVAKKKKG